MQYTSNVGILWQIFTTVGCVGCLVSFGRWSLVSCGLCC